MGRKTIKEPKKKIEVRYPKQEDAKDPLASFVLAELSNARSHTDGILIDGEPLVQVIERCRGQREGDLFRYGELNELVDQTNITGVINFSQLKASVLENLLKDMFFNSGDIPFIIRPTPIAELPDEAVYDIYDRVKDRIVTAINNTTLEQQLEDNPSKQLYEYILDEGDKMHKHLAYLADKRAQRVEDIMKDQIAESELVPEMNKFLYDFVTYPFAVLCGPIPVYDENPFWNNGRFEVKMDTRFNFLHIPPSNIKWSSDSKTTKDGRAVFIQQHISRHKLYAVRNQPNYIAKSITDLHNECRMPHYSMNNSLKDSTNPNGSDNDTVVMHSRYGRCLGRDLTEAGLKFPAGEIDLDNYYESIIHVVEGRVVFFRIIHPTEGYIRPIHTASYISTGNGIVGKGIPQLIYDTEREYNINYKSMLYNLWVSGNPSGEASASRLSKYLENMSKEGEVADGTTQASAIFPPGLIALVEDDPSNSSGGAPAIRYHSLPNMTSQYASILSMLRQQITELSGIPESLHGQPVGTGANRTAYGIAQLLANASIPVKMGYNNIFDGVFKHIGIIMYRYLLINGEADVKGDCEVRPQSLEGALENASKQQKLLEVIQVISQFGDRLPAHIMNTLIEDFVRSYGIDIQPGTLGEQPTTQPPVVPNTSTKPTDVAGNPLASAPTEPVLDGNP